MQRERGIKKVFIYMYIALRPLTVKATHVWFCFFFNVKKKAQHEAVVLLPHQSLLFFITSLLQEQVFLFHLFHTTAIY